MINKSRYNSIYRRFAQWLIYSILFTLVFVLVFAVMFANNRSFVEITDGIVLRFPATEYGRSFFSDIFKGNGIRQWDWGIGYGANPMMDLSGISEVNDPFYLFALPFTKVTESVYLLLIYLRIYAMGVAFLLLAKTRNYSFVPSTAGSFLYCFTTYTLLYGTKHPCFILPMIWLPLIFAGIEQVLKKRSPYFLTVGVSLAAFSSVYFFWMLVLFACAYFIVRFCTTMKGKFHIQKFFFDIGCIIVWAVIGIGMAAIMLIPSLRAVLISSRAVESGFQLTDGEFFEYLISSLTSFFSDFHTVNSMGIIALPIIGIGLSKRKKYTDYKCLFVICILIFSSVFIRSVLNVFSFPTYRWSMFLYLTVSLMCTAVLNDMRRLSKKDFRVMIGALGAFSSSALLSFHFELPYRSTISIALIIGGLCVGILKLYCFLEMRYFRKRQYTIYIVLSTIVFCLVANGYITFSDRYEGKALSEFVAKGSVDEYYYGENERIIENIKDDGFYRVDMQKYGRSSANGHARDNSGLVFNYNGVTSAKSLLYSGIYEFYEINEIRGTINGCEHTSLDDRCALVTLLGQKYIVTDDSVKNDVPYGFEQVARYDQKSVYMNKYDVGIGFATDQYMLVEDLMNISSEERQNAMLQTVVLDEEPENGIKYVSESSGEYENIDYRIVETNDIEIEENRITVKNDNGIIKLEAENTKNKELYVVFENISFLNNGDKKGGMVTVKCNGTEKKRKNRYPEFEYYTTNQPGIYNLGMQLEERAEIEIIFEKKSVIDFEALKIVTYDLSEYDAVAQKAVDNRLENVVYTNDMVEGDIYRDNDSILFVSIPYSAGWHAYVNGDEVEVMSANIGFSAIELEKGYNEVRFIYKSPYLWISIIISSLSFLGFVTLLFWNRKFRGITK